MPISRFTIFAALALTLAVGGKALAHAHLTRAVPEAGSSSKTPPHAVTLTFTQKLEGAFSTIEVVDASGARVDTGKADLDPADSTVMRIGLKTLAPGTYKVQWQALSVDTHKTEGSFNFTVEP